MRENGSAIPSHGEELQLPRRLYDKSIAPILSATLMCLDAITNATTR